MVPSETAKAITVRQLPPPPTSGLRRSSVIVSVYAISVVLVSLINLLIMWFAAWLTHGVPLLSGPGLIVLAPSLAVSVWLLLYTLGKLEKWRRLKPQGI